MMPLLSSNLSSTVAPGAWRGGGGGGAELLTTGFPSAATAVAKPALSVWWN